MKQLFTLALITIALSFQLSAQTVNDVPIKDIDVEYVQIVGTPRWMTNKLNVHIDFGQENKLFSSARDTRIRDANGNNMTFNSMIDALNFMSANGYEFVQAFSSTAGDTQGVQHYLLRRKKITAPK